MTESNKTAVIRFLKGVDEPCVPEIRLTRSRDGRTGQAFFTFEGASALSSVKDGTIQGMSMIDEEGELVSRDVKARFLDGEPSAIEVTYIWKSELDFERFMRFAKRYAEINGLGYQESC